MRKCKVSVIVPVYNTAQYLDECIQSIIGQTEPDIEVLLINDGSTDHSLEILRKYAQQDDRLRVIDIMNHGVSYVRNMGIRAAAADWIMFVDADDSLPSNSIALLYHSVSDDVDLISGDYRDYVSADEIKDCQGQTRRSSSLSCKERLNCCCIVNPHTHKRLYKSEEAVYPSLTFVWGKIYRKSVLLNNDLFFDEALSRGEDQEFNIRYVNACLNVNAIDAIVYFYRNRTLSASRSWTNACAEYLQYASVIGKRVREKDDPILLQYWNLKKFEIIMKMLALVSASPNIELKERIAELKRFVKSEEYSEALHGDSKILSRQQAFVQKLLRLNLFYTTVLIFKIRFR